MGSHGEAGRGGRIANELGEYDVRNEKHALLQVLRRPPLLTLPSKWGQSGKGPWKVSRLQMRECTRMVVAVVKVVTMAP